jgi:Na+-driven multidrug efflux pump
MALVFPVVMLVQMVSAGAMGGISSAVARALGSGRRDEADALVLHAVIVNVALGAFSRSSCSYSTVDLPRWGTDGELHTALSYLTSSSPAIFYFWLMNALASVIRGTATCGAGDGDPAGVVFPCRSRLV